MPSEHPIRETGAEKAPEPIVTLVRLLARQAAREAVAGNPRHAPEVPSADHHHERKEREDGEEA